MTQDGSEPRIRLLHFALPGLVRGNALAILSEPAVSSFAGRMVALSD